MGNIPEFVPCTVNADKQHLPVCSCGKKLEKMKIKSNPIMNSICCNHCYKPFKTNSVIYHCSQQNKNIHPAGYDICVQCRLHHRSQPYNCFVDFLLDRLSNIHSNDDVTDLNKWLKTFNYDTDAVFYDVLTLNKEIQSTSNINDYIKLKSLTLNIDEIENAINEFKNNDNDPKQYELYDNNKNDALNKLMSMGFERNKSLLALLMCNNDISLAAHYIVDVDAQNMSNKHISNNFTQQVHNDQPCNIKDCIALSNISNILKYNNKWILSHNKDNNNTINKPMSTMHEYVNNILHNGQYNNLKLLNDFHHLIESHNDEFEDIYNYLIKNVESAKECDKLKCKLYSRNHRNRAECSINNERISKLFYGYDSTKEIIIHQIIDNIHCYFLHSFDCGYRLTRNEQQLAIVYNENENKKNINDPQNDENYNFVFSKYTEIIQSKKKDNIISDLHKNKFNINQNMFSFGTQFVYPEWDGFIQLKEEKDTIYIDETSNVKMIPIDYKYASFKEELIQNSYTCPITCTQWEFTYGKAACNLKTKYCSKWQPTNDEIKQSKEEIKYVNNVFIIKQKILVDHLIAIIIYCSYDALSTKFSETYRKIANDNQDQKLIARHRNFGYLGRYLHEACFYFNDVNRGTFYHGINKSLHFDHTVGTFYSPFSASTEFAVAAQFATNLGLILELKSDTMIDLYSGCKCWWISDFGAEKETLFLGRSALRMVDIITLPQCKHFRKYLRAFNIIQTMVRGTWYDSDRNICTETKQLVKTLLSHQLHHSGYKPAQYLIFETIPIYIHNLLRSYCINQHVITIKWQAINQECYDNVKVIKHIKGYKFLNKYLCTSNPAFINLNLFSGLFPNATILKISLYPRNPQYKINDMIEAVIWSTNIGFTLIEFHCDKAETFLLNEIVQTYQNFANDNNWKISMASDDDLVFLIIQKTKN